jgi:hypothetical protein
MADTVKGVEIDPVREKLVELLENDYCPLLYVLGDSVETLADYLIAHSVTVQEWISVKDRLPDTIPCSAGTAYSEAVNVLTDGRKVLTAIWDGTTFLCDADYWEAWGEKITHWTPVLLPLPQPPKSENTSNPQSEGCT